MSEIDDYSGRGEQENATITFTCQGEQFSVDPAAAKIGTLIYIKTSDDPENPRDWFGLRVTEVSSGQPPAITAVAQSQVEVKPAALRHLFQNGHMIESNTFIFQGFPVASAIK
jgi:hypothetical protein